MLLKSCDLPNVFYTQDSYAITLVLNICIFVAFRLSWISNNNIFYPAIFYHDKALYKSTFTLPYLTLPAIGRNFGNSTGQTCDQRHCPMLKVMADQQFSMS